MAVPSGCANSEKLKGGEQVQNLPSRGTRDWGQLEEEPHQSAESQGRLNACWIEPPTVQRSDLSAEELPGRKVAIEGRNAHVARNRWTTPVGKTVWTTPSHGVVP